MKETKTRISGIQTYPLRERVINNEQENRVSRLGSLYMSGIWDIWDQRGYDKLEANENIKISKREKL